MGLDAEVYAAENVFARLVNHKKDCKIVEAGAHGLDLPERYCDCGVLGSTYGISIFTCHNVVTNDGDRFYAEVAQLGIFTAGNPPGSTIVPAFDFDQMTLVGATTGTPAKGDTADTIDGTIPSGGTQDIDGTYPFTNDTDTNNPGTTGVDILTWRRSYTTGQANGVSIEDVVIHETGATFGGVTGDPLLMHATFGGAFTKTTADTLNVYVNHQFDGAV